MQVHFDNDQVRLGLSHRNLLRLVAHYKDKGCTVMPVMQSGDVFRDGQEVVASFMIGIEAAPTEVIIRGNYVSLHLHDLLLNALADQLDTLSEFEEPLADNVVLYIESDELHYAKREAGIAANAPLR